MAQDSLARNEQTSVDLQAAPSAAQAIVFPLPAESPRRSAQVWAIYAPLLIGLIARLIVIGDVRFTGDEAHYYSEGWKIAKFAELPWYGARMSFSGHLPGPLFYVFCAVPLLFSTDPVGIHLWILLVNTLAILLLGRMAFRLHGPRGALIVTALLSSSPWHFTYSMGIWEPHIFMPMFAVTVWCLDSMRLTPRSKTIAILAALLVAAFQIHPSCLFLWALAIVALIIYRPRINWAFLAIGTVLAAVTYLPYLMHELGTNFQNTRMVLSDTGNTEKWGWSLANPLRALWGHFMLTSANINYHIIHGYWLPPPKTLADELLQFWSPMDGTLTREFGWLGTFYKLSNVTTQALAAVVTLLWLVALVWTTWRRRWRRTDTLTIAFLLCPLIVFITVFIGRKPVYPHYLLFALAAPFFGYILLDRWIADASRSKLKWLVTAVTLVLFLPRLAVGYQYHREIDCVRGLNAQKALAIWIAPRGQLSNMFHLLWYDYPFQDPTTRMSEPIPLTLARCWRPELLKQQPPGGDRFSLIARACRTPEEQAAYISDRIHRRVQIVDAQINDGKSTFVRWRFVPRLADAEPASRR